MRPPDHHSSKSQGASGNGHDRPPKDGKNSAWEWFKGTKWWAKALMGFGALIVLVAIFGEDPEEQAKSDEPATVAEAQAEPEPTPEPVVEAPEPEPTPPSPREQIREALANAEAPGEDPDVKGVNFLGRLLNVIVETPEGGLQGPSTTDLNYMAQSLFQAIYDRDPPFRRTTVLEFTGGLVDEKTGRDSDSVTARYEMERSDSHAIDWSDSDALDFINWSLYRVFTHPAIKMDDPGGGSDGDEDDKVSVSQAVDLLDLAGSPVAEFCAAYLDMAAEGLEGLALQSFSEGYGDEGAFGHSSREIFDEYVSRC